MSSLPPVLWFFDRGGPDPVDPIWLTADRRSLRPAEMTDRHVANCELWLTAWVSRWSDELPDLLSDPNAARMIIRNLETLHAWLKVFREESERRGLA